MIPKKQNLTNKEIALELTKLTNALAVAMLNDGRDFDPENLFTIVENNYQKFVKLTKQDKQ